MKGQWLIIPALKQMEEAVSLAEKYGAALEYNDFWHPEVYEEEAEVKRRINFYKTFSRDRSKDTIHGAFLDIAVASRDKEIRRYSRMRVEHSVAVAAELGVKGVVLHSGLLPGLNAEYYIRGWLEAEEDLLRMLAEKYPQVELYLENTFEQSPEVLTCLAKRMQDVRQFGLCLDYAHAMLTETPGDIWMGETVPFLKHIHINDNDLISDLHQVPGHGAINFNEFAILLEKYNVNVPMLLELEGIDNQRKALEYMTVL